MSKEAMKLALEALENSIDLVSNEAREAEKLYGKYQTRLARIQGLVALEVAHEKAITALREALAEQPAQQALDKKAENARELGLDYEPAQEKYQSVMYTYPSKPEPIPCGKPIGILMKQKGDEHMKLYLLPEQPAQSTADKSELETVPANGGLLPAQQEPVACRDEMCACRGGPCASCADGEREKEQPAQQEPVAWARNLTDPQPHCVTDLKYMSVADTDSGVQYTPLYTAPQAQRTWVGLNDEEKSDLWCESTGRDCVNEDTHVFADAIEAKLMEKNT